MRFLVVIIALGSALEITAQEQRRYPVQLGAGLTAASTSELGERLNAPFIEGMAHPKGVNNCSQLLSIASMPAASAGQDTQATRINCLALRELSSARPARSSHVADLKWNARVLSLLPAELAINVSDEAIHKARGKAWTDLDRTASASESGADQIVVKGEGFTESLILLGRGDFDDSGSQDLLVKTLDTLTGGTYRNIRLFVLGRKTATARLRVVRELR